MTRRHYDRRPPVGELVAVARKPWRVERIEDVGPGDWSDEARDQWIAERMPDPWLRAPFEVIVTPAEGGPEHSTTIEPGQYVTWHVLPEHYAVCVSCGELAPCREHTAMVQAHYVMRRVERDMRTLPGCCPACQEPITRRQESVTFAGENLLVPLGPPDVTYHVRAKCRGSAARYEEMWVNDDPTRPRSLLTLRCAGALIVHQDGSAECHGAEDCPSVYAHHGRFAACFTQSGGCGRGCSRAGHPGCRVAGYPKGVRL